jgi:laccase
MIAPGQTMNMLLEANRPTDGSANNRYYMATHAFATNIAVNFDKTNATAILEYTDAPPFAGPPDSPDLPAFGDIATATAYTA